MEDKKLDIKDEVIEETKAVEEIPVEVITEEVKEEIVEEIKEVDEDTPTILNISFDAQDINLLLNALTIYSEHLKENKRTKNKLVIDEEFNNHIDKTIGRTDELRFLIKKEALIVDKKLKLTSMVEQGEVIGIEVFTSTEEGVQITESIPRTVGHTPEVKPDKVKPAKTSVKSVSEEL